MNRYTRRNVLWRFFILTISLAILLYCIAWGINTLFSLNSAHTIKSLSLTDLLIILLEILAMILLYRLLPQFFNFLIGDRGEIVIGKQLHKLEPEFTVFSDTELHPKHGNIDFILVGHNGVTIIEVKSHDGTIEFKNGKLVRVGRPLEKNFIWQINSQAKELHDFLVDKIGLDIRINKFIIFTSKYAKLRFGIRPLPGTDIIVVKKEWMNNLVLGQKGTYLNQNTVVKIVQLLNHYSG